ncbi:MAG: galactokinase [Desulfobacterales bacterium]|nr:galactokinase [Desulfobacterales bacterium]
MHQSVRKYLEENGSVKASAPVRVDLGGTLDISTLHYPLRHLRPQTFNAAVGLRTGIRLSPWADGQVKVTSRGFTAAAFAPDLAPYNHPLGLMFAVAGYFGLTGLHIEIDSASPPRSALGGSSSATVALVAACSRLPRGEGRPVVFSREQTALLAHHIEAGVAGVPCGLQDQLAAAYGGIHAWHWHAGPEGTGFRREPLLNGKGFEWFAERTLLAYCGNPHESRDVNSRWIAQFIDARTRSEWAAIVDCTAGFIDAMKKGDPVQAAGWMNRETDIRLKLTPDVLDSLGSALYTDAADAGCGARFSGAGGGGCVWAFGRQADIRNLKSTWASRMEAVDTAVLLEVTVDTRGVIVNN